MVVRISIFGATGVWQVSGDAGTLWDAGQRVGSPCWWTESVGHAVRGGGEPSAVGNLDIEGQDAEHRKPD